METIAHPNLIQKHRSNPAALAELLDAVRGGARKVRARGLVGASRGHALWQLTRELKVPLVCVVPTEDSAEALEKDLRFFAPETTGAAMEQQR